MAKGTDTTVTAELDALRASVAAIGLRAAIAAARVPMAYPDVKAAPVRRFVSIACTAEVRHAEADARGIVAALGVGGYFDPRNGTGPADFHLTHEAKAGVALVWLSHLQGHDNDRHGPSIARDHLERWNRWDHARKAEWLARRRYLVHGLIRAANAYRAARAALA